MSPPAYVSGVSDLWVHYPRPNQQASLRLFCFPYAGAGSSMYQVWANLLPNIEIGLVQLPGRDKRIKEELHTRLHPLIDSLADGLSPHLNKPFAFFGHSMGSLVSFETARQLRRKQAVQPIHLFVSARTPPQTPDPYRDVYKLSEQEFLKATENLYGAMPDVIRQDSEILKLFLTIMRADLTMMGTYQYTPESPLDFPITVYGGLDDQSVTEDVLRTWSEQTTGAFRLKMFPGDHFFIQRSRRELIEEMAETLF